jgi:putative membrane protein
VRVRSFLLRAALVATTLVVLARVLPQVVVPEDPVDLVGIAALFGVSNALVRPAVHLLALPIRLATVGLVTFVLNGVLVLGVAFVAGELELGFSIGGFPPDLSPVSLGVAIVVAAVLGVVSTAASLVVPDL